MALENYLTVQETADYLKVSKDTIVRLCVTGRLFASRINRSWRVPESGIKTYLDSSVRKPPEQRYIVPKLSKGNGELKPIKMEDIKPA